ncbi:MAG: helix-turn-helix domain-containing protein [Pseudomonadota bacterium]|nr:MAG: helix-turn-helix domain-containing protein [Pseudomonadota bacterium]
MDTIVYSLESHDFEEMEQTLSGWDHQYQQISPGAFRGSLLHTQTGSIGIFRNRWERAIHYQGVAPKGAIGLAITLSQTEEGRWLGQRAGIDDVIIQRCGAEAEYLSAPLWDSVVFVISEEELVNQFVGITDGDPYKLLHTHGVVHLIPPLAAQVRQACLSYLQVAAHSIAAPDAASLVSAMANSTLALVVRALVSSLPTRDIRHSVNRHRQLINKAREFSAHCPEQPLRIGELCRAIGASERTMRDAFHKTTGMSPLAYLKNERLNRVYRSLRDADPTEVLIKQIAYDNGFVHLGQFCGDYKALFGELPSETLQR